MLHAVIMAGGSGTRFWPESRSAKPKQLLPLAGPRTMIQATLDRLAGLVPAERTLIVTGESLAEAIRRQLPQLPEQSILAEPCRRDTAPCIGLAALSVSRHDPDATLVVMPADHVIQPDDVFCRTLQLAADLVEESPGRIVTFGITPTYPAEIFGYIERGERLPPRKQPGGADSPAVYRVTRFREKPSAAAAREYLASGEFYWNSGIFVWKARTILDALAARQPEMHAHLSQIAAAQGTPDYAETLRREFTAIKPISIDYAVMEQATDVAVIAAPFEWDDVGTWQSLARLNGQDEHDNTILAKHLGISTTGSIIRGEGEHLIVTLGVQDLIVVQTPDVTLVANKHDEESIRKLVKLLEERGWKGYL